MVMNQISTPFVQGLINPHLKYLKKQIYPLTTAQIWRKTHEICTTSIDNNSSHKTDTEPM